MASLVTLRFAFVALACIVGSTSGLYEDQVGKFDWHQKYFGKIDFILNDANQPKRIIVGSKRNVIGAINSNSGAVLYRHVLEATSQLDYLGVIDRTLLAVSSSDGATKIRLFEASTGVSTGEHTIPVSNLVSVTEHNSRVYFISGDQDGSKVEISHVELPEKQMLDAEVPVKKSHQVDMAVEEPKKCIVVAQYYVCASSKTLAVLNVDDGSLSRRPLLGTDTGYDVTVSGNGPLPCVSVVTGRVTKVFRIIENKKNGPELVPVFNADGGPGAYSLSQGELDSEPVLFLAHLVSPQEIKVYVYDKNLKPIDGKGLTVKSSTPVTSLYITKGFCVNSRCAFVGFTPDELLFGSKIDSQSSSGMSNVKVEWTRHEALGSIIAADMMDFPSESGPSWNPYMTQTNAISAFIARIKYEVETVVYGESFYSSAMERFGLRKIIVLVTAVGKVFGMDSATGSVLYSFLLPEFTLLKNGNVFLYIQRPAKFAPLKPLASVLYRSSNSAADTTIVYPFNPVDGKPLDQPQTYPPLVQSQLLSHATEQTNFLKPILMLDANLVVHTYPANLPAPSRTFFFVATKGNDALLKGYSVQSSASNNKLKGVQLWDLNLGNTELLGVYGKHPNEKVHSQGKVLPDRSVSYKYMNPNLVVVVTSEREQGNINVYFVDAVAGSIIHSFWHKKCKGPVHVVHSEHWVVYSLFNDKSRRFEVNSVELFEGLFQSNATAFTSFAAPPVQPIVVKQSYIFPTGIQSMAHTTTEKGITSKDVLVALPTGAVVELPRMLIQPRLSASHYVQHHDEDGVLISMPYIPELPVPSEMIINYNQSSKRIAGIKTWPTRLESTCLVLVHGLDLFYTRVFPSKTFDVLKDDFDHWLICVVLVGLIGAAYGTKRLAAKKQLEQAWR